MKLKRFTFNNSKYLSKAFRIRQVVFVEEQMVDRDEEFDEYDKSSIHYLVLRDDKALGTARWRITENGIKLERFAVLLEERGKGVGDLLLKGMIREIPVGYKAYMHAQVSALSFYEKNGFVKSGPMFSECDIDHYEMELKGDEKESNLSLSETIEFVKDFHTSFGLPVKESPSVAIEQDLIALRYKLMHEENEEYLDAAKEGDLIEVADALGDMLYILCGSILTHGLQYKIGEVYEEIQRSNMSKLDENGNPIYREDGKVMKSNLYSKPDLATILKKK
jgi:predicted GNAT family N-acyltransferase/predicted HAD superfamily Cof-like phosphohydrolase